MSPDPGADEQSVADTLSRVTLRARTLAVAEALVWGIAAAAIVAVVSPLVALIVLTWKLRAATRLRLVRAMERTHRDARNLFVTAEELSRGVLAAKPEVRQRVFARAALEARRIDRRAIAPMAPVVRAAAVAGAVWLVVGAATVWRRPLTQLGRAWSPAAESNAARSHARGSIRLTATLTPPPYTRLPPRSAIDPPQIEAVEGTVATVLIEGPAERVTVEHETTKRNLARDQAGRFVDRLELRKTGYYAIETDAGGRRVIPLVVSPDALPSIRITAPGRDLVYGNSDRRVDFAVQAADDFGLRALGLEFTKVSGSGEQFEFRDGQIPLTLSKTGERNWRGSATQSLAGLDLKEGDMLVYRAVATDTRPGDGTARSDPFFIEISKLAAAAGDAFTVPEEETRYALSQQMLIVKTERLEQTRASMAAADRTDAALNLAVEQRMIRAEFVFMLGGEIQDEDVEAEQSSELQAGRLQNRGQRDLRAATVAMSQAEKLLTGGSLRDALTAERAAVFALQRAFARNRYILRALGSRTELDPKRRLTGNLTDATGWRRDRPTAQPNRRAALLQDLLAGIGALRKSSAESGSSQTATTDAIALAREALRIDAGSTVLRTAAAELQRIADRWSTTPVDARAGAIDTVASAVAAEAVAALASAPLRPMFDAPALAGGFADGLRLGGSK